MKLAEYIWIDGTQPTSRLRSKTRVLQDDQDPDIWGFDGSSTEQAEGINSDCVLFPVMACADPIRRENSLLVLCEVYDTDLAPQLILAPFVGKSRNSLLRMRLFLDWSKSILSTRAPALWGSHLKVNPTPKANTTVLWALTPSLGAKW